MKRLFFFLLWWSTLNAHAQQDIPLGTWRLHLSYNTINSISTNQQKIFAASTSGVLVVDKTDGSVETINQLNGLGSSGITDIAFAENTDALVITYSDGSIDLAGGDDVFNFDRLRTANYITGSRRINRVTVTGSVAFMAADFGVVVFDLITRDLRETWRNIGRNASALRIFDTALVGDSIFLATERGVMVGNVNRNLLDFNAWKRFDEGSFNTPVHEIETFGSEIYASVPGTGLLRYANGTWTPVQVDLAGPATSLRSSVDELVIVSSGEIYRLSLNGALTDAGYTGEPNVAVSAGGGVLYVGDATTGLRIGNGEDFQSVTFNGPQTNDIRRITFDNDRMVVFGVEQTTNTLSFFENGFWNTALEGPADASDIATTSQTEFIASLSVGLQRRTGETVTVVDNTNSTLEVDPVSGRVDIRDLFASGNGVWALNYGALNAVQYFENENVSAYSLPYPGGRYLTKGAVDQNGFLWLAVDAARGGGIALLDPVDNESDFKTQGVGNGNLPSSNVNDLVVDRDNNVWVGTDLGVCYFFSAQEDAVTPLFENRFLLRGEKVTAIDVDGGNRKWIGTERGVWLFNPTGETLVYNFTTENSPLISNRIRDIEINDKTGEVFLVTDRGLISFRSDATSGAEEMQSVKIFPNPVDRTFAGTVGIEGLSTDAFVKITDVSGKLIWQTQANGGTATWNVRDYNGRRAETGIYLVFAASADGNDRIVGKIAVIE